MSETLNAVLRQNIEKKISHGSESAKTAVKRLIDEGRISRDFIAYLGHSMRNETQMTFDANGHVNMLLPTKGNSESLTIHPHAITQIGEKLEIPPSYLRSLSEGNEHERKLAAHIMNQHSGWTGRSRALIRIVGNEVRGVLSDSYRRLNGEIIVKAFLEEMEKQGGVLADGAMTDTKLFIETLLPEPIEIPTAKNGTILVAFGARLSTSDYGDGRLEMRSFMLQGACANGMVRESQLSVRHLGARLPEDIMISQRTYDLDTRTQASAIRDITKTLYSSDMIRKRAKEIQAASQVEIDVERELKNLMRGKIQKGEAEEIGRLIMRSKPEDGLEGESTLWKLVQGITAHARDIDPRRSRDLQEIAGELLSRVE